MTLVIVASNDEPFIGEVVKAAKNNREYDEIMVIDNSSTDYTAYQSGLHGAYTVIRLTDYLTTKQVEAIASTLANGKHFDLLEFPKPQNGALECAA